MEVPVYFFGCWSERQKGHFLFNPSGRTLYEDYLGDILAHTLDGRYQPAGTDQREGEFKLTYTEQMTILACWDRSADSRRNSCAVAVAFGRKTDADMVALLRQHFPEQAQRISAFRDFATEPAPEALRVREGDQPLPVKNDHPVIQRLVQQDIDARLQVGIQRYGTGLQPHNGRDAIRDLYEELLDAATYARQLLYERDGK